MEEIEEYYIGNRLQISKYLCRRMGKPEDAEDVLQNAFYRALKWKHTRRGEKVSSWMYSIIENAIKDYKKKERGQEADFFIEISEEPVSGFAQDIDRFLSNIKSPLKKRVLELYLKDGLKMVEIFRLLNIPYSTVKSIVRRFRDEIKNKGYV